MQECYSILIICHLEDLLSTHEHIQWADLDVKHNTTLFLNVQTI